jgi:hypothetical protein
MPYCHIDSIDKRSMADFRSDPVTVSDLFFRNPFKDNEFIICRKFGTSFAFTIGRK